MLLLCRPEYKGPVNPHLIAVGALALVALRATPCSAEEVPREEPVETKPPEPVEAKGSIVPRGFGMRGIGLRGSAAELRAPAANAGSWSGGGDLYARGIGVLRLDFLSARYFDELWIGYGSEGLRYQLAGQLGLGGIWLFDDAHGAVLRFAMRGDLRREGRVFSSEIRLPGGELGYSWSRGKRQVELVGHIGSTLTGRFNPEEQTRHLRGVTYGASLSFSLARLRLDGDLSQVAARSELGAVTHIRAHFCWLSEDRPGRKERASKAPLERPPPPGWAICSDFRLLRGRTEPEAAYSQQFVGGLSVVIGELAHP